MRNVIIEETLSAALSRLRRLLPSTWSADVAAASEGRADATISLKGPGNASALLDVAVKRWTTAPTSKVVGVLSGVQRTTPNPVLLVTDYTNRPLRLPRPPRRREPGPRRRRLTLADATVAAVAGKVDDAAYWVLRSRRLIMAEAQPVPPVGRQHGPVDRLGTDTHRVKSVPQAELNGYPR